MAPSTSRGTKGSLAGCGSWLQGQRRGKQGGREGRARCQLSGAGCVLISQDFSLPVAPGFGAGTVTFPEASQEAPEGWASPRCQESLVAASCGLVAGRVDLAGCWAQKSTAHHLLVAELLEDAHEHLSLHSHERDGKALLGCSACRDAVNAL